MDTLIIILVAAAVAVVAWTFFQVVTGAANAPKRKRQQRLSSQSGIQSTGVGPQPSIRLLEIDDLGGLARIPTAQLLRTRLTQAFPGLSIKVFLVISVLLGAGGASVGWILTAATIPTAGFALVATYLPYFIIQRKRASWNKKITEQVPDALDFLSRVLRAGQSLATGL